MNSLDVFQFMELVQEYAEAWHEANSPWAGRVEALEAEALFETVTGRLQELVERPPL